MDKQARRRVEFDEFEKLLGEIPNATEESLLKSAYLNGTTLSPICVNSKLQNNNNMLNKSHQCSTKRVQSQPDQETNLPADQSLTLTSAFARLSFNHQLKLEATPLSTHKSFQNHSISLDGKFSNGSLRKQGSNTASPVMVVSESHHNIPSGLYEFNGTKLGQETSNLLKFNPEEEQLQRCQVSYCQPIHGAFQILPNNVPAPGMQIPILSDHQQHFFLDAQSRLPYLQPQHDINQQHQIFWRNMEEEQYYRMQQRYLCLQQLQNQRLGLEGQHLLQENRNIPCGLISRNQRQPHFEVSFTHQLERFNQEPFWDNHAITRGLHQSNHAFFSKDYNVMKALDKERKHKVLTSISHGLNTLKFGSVGMEESFDQNGKVHSNVHFRHNLTSLSAGSFKLDNLNQWGLFYDNADTRITDPKSLPQKYYSLDDIPGRIYLMAKDQNGCRFLQRKFAQGTQKDIEKIFVEIIDHIIELMTDPFGNYLIQKLLEVCNEDQRMQILHSVTRKSGELVRISCDMHGTRAVQKVIETLNTPEQFSLVVSTLNPGILTLIKNMNGNHVAQRCLQYLMPEYVEFMFEAATTNCVELATNRHGCCVLQKCLSYSDGEKRRRLVHEITSNALILSQDPFGNYVVQFVFELQLPWATADILDQLDGNYGDLSMQKHSSNVVEKTLKYSSEERRSRIIQELIDNPRLDQIMQDPYGNYVIQAALNQSKGSLRAKLVEAIKLHVPVLRTNPYGKKVLSSNSLKK